MSYFKLITKNSTPMYRKCTSELYFAHEDLADSDYVMIPYKVTGLILTTLYGMV